MRFRSFVFVAFFSSALSGSALAQPSASGRTTGFDGDWQVTMTCPNNTEKSAARGYKRQFPAQVKNGVLRGEIGVADSAGWLRIEGLIDGDGNARLDAHGRTGEPDYAVQHPPPSSPYSFHIDARFEAARGSGRRLEQRACNFVFERR
jgi:hypothetical protein